VCWSLQICYLIVFFFSSRRRHTRWPRDWSSDVCSSDLIADEDERALLHTLVEARLLVADHVGGATGFRVAHEALLRRWPRVTARSEERRVGKECRSGGSPYE